MRVVLVVPGFPKLSETFIVRKFVGLLASGCDAHVVCAHSDPAAWRHFPELDAPGIRRRVHVAGGSRAGLALHAPATLAGVVLHRGGRRYLRDRRTSLATRLKRACLDAPIIRLRPDIVHFEFGSLAVGRTHLRRLLGCRLVASFRGYDISYVGLDQPHYYDRVWREADALHFLGRDLWRRALDRGCPPDIPHAFITPAVDATQYASARVASPHVLGTREHPLRIVSVGRLTWKKGYEHALVAVRRLLDAGVHCRYTIVGGGDYLEPLAFARHELGLEQHVELAGPQPPARVGALLDEADVMLHAAVSEGFCNAVLEAQAVGLPVVTSDAEGLSENVLDGATGFVVPRRDPAALAERLALLAGDPAMRRRMGEAGRRRVREAFRLEDQVRAFLDLYAGVLDRADGAGRATVGGANPRHTNACS